MLTNCKGFSMVEVLVSFSLILLVVTAQVPILMKIYQERMKVDFHKDALLVLHNEKETFLYDEHSSMETKMLLAPREFIVSYHHQSPLVQLCVEWTVPWNEKGKVCDYAKAIN